MVEVTEDPRRAAIDVAIERALAAPELSGVYLSPWWPMGTAEGADGAVGWKRSILRREPGRGAVHWGHLYLLLGVGTRPGSTTAVGLGGPVANRSPIAVELPLALAKDVSLWLRPRLREPCEMFARRLHSELAGPVPETS